MKLPSILVATMAASLLVEGILGEEQATKKKTKRSDRVVRQTSADQMVQNILHWLQGVYTQQSRRSRFAEFDTLFNFASDKLDDAFRQGSFREYLPPTNTQKPRPFETVSPPKDNGISGSDDYLSGGYPPAGSITPQPPFPIYTNPATGAVTGEGYPSTGYPTGYPAGPITGPLIPNGPGSYPTPGFPTYRPEISTHPAPGGYPTAKPTTAEVPTQPPEYPSERPGYPTQPSPGITGYPSERPGFPTQPPTGYPSEKPGYPTQPPASVTSGYPSEKPGFPTQPPPGYTTGYPSEKPGYSTQPPSGFTGYPSEKPSYPTQPPASIPTELPTYSPSGFTTSQAPGLSTSSENPTTSPPASPTQPFTSATTPEEQPAAVTTQSPEANTIPTERPEKPPGDTAASETDADEDLNHPPHIHAIEVECAKDMMTINIEFNREFNGVIYSKGYYNMPECRYVKEDSGQTKYSFTVNLNMCGTEFINAFDTQGQSYLENVLVLQNEVGIQEIWDTVRAVRCLWEGNLKESLSVALSVGMLTQEIVTFSGDTAMAKLDIQLGRGPFGQPANGLVKIGEPMTLAVSVSGDPGFDIQVKDCKATDSTGDNIVPLTDDNGCVLKPKLFGAFQKTRDTQNTGASIIAYAYFNAFKFPDVMDLMIECNIELCKTNCEMCTNPNQKLEPGRRKRDVYSLNETLHDGVTMGKHLRIILPEDINDKTFIDLGKKDEVCMSVHSFVFSTCLLISLLAVSILFSAYMWVKNQRLYPIKK